MSTGPKGTDDEWPVTIHHFSGATLILHDYPIKDKDEQAVLKEIGNRLSELGNLLVARKKPVIGAAQLMEEHPSVSSVLICVQDEDVEHLRLIEEWKDPENDEPPTPGPFGGLYLDVGRLHVSVREDPGSIEIEVILKLLDGAKKYDKQLGQVVYELPDPFVCETWAGETVLPES